MSMRASLLALLQSLRDPQEPMPPRPALIAALEAILADNPAGGRGRPSVDLLPALQVMGRLGSARSSGDVGRALEPELRTSAEKACSLGANRLRQLVQARWVVRHDLGGWSITEKGREELRRRSEGLAA